MHARVCINNPEEEIAFSCLTALVCMVLYMYSPVCISLWASACMHVCGIADIRTHAYVTYSNRCNNIMLPTCKWVST